MAWFDHLLTTFYTAKWQVTAGQAIYYRIAVDLVGVPELLHFRYYPSAILYAIYAGFVIWGFIVWLRLSRAEAGHRVGTPAPATA